MKYLMIFSLLIANVTTLFSQIHGNGQMTTKTIDVKDLRSLDIQFNANIILDYQAEEKMSLTVDDNLVDLVGIAFSNGKLTLDQVKWIEPSKRPSIIIGCPKLQRVFQGTHSTTKMINADLNDLLLEGNVGKIIAEGRVKNLRINVSGTDLNLEELVVGTAKVELLQGSKLKLKEVTRLETQYKEDKRIKLLEAPEEHIAKEEKHEGSNNYEANPNLKWIPFKIKNNSFSRKHFVVVGPKRSGSTFSYGFSMFPYTSKSEKWSVGTKIYKEGRRGERTLLVTIKESDEGTVVDLFE